MIYTFFGGEILAYKPVFMQEIYVQWATFVARETGLGGAA